MVAIAVKQNLVPESKYKIKCPYPMDAEYITFHNTANDASAQGEVSYMVGNNNQVSYHFAVDEKEVVQGIPTNRNAWHCGDGDGTGNRKSIGVEVCYSKSGGAKYKKAEALAIKFIAQLLHERGWGVDRVHQHHHWSGKNCPHRVRAEGRWDEVVASIQKELDALRGTKTKTTVVKSAPKASKGYLSKGDTGAAVKELQEDLIKLGYKLPKYGADGSYGDETVQAVKKLQKDNKIAVDGLAGNATMQIIDALKSKPKSTSKKTTTKSASKTKGDMKTTSIVDYLTSIGEDSSFSNRAKLAKSVGITNYTGSAHDNTELLNKLRNGSKSTATPKKEAKVVSGIRAIGEIKIVGVRVSAIVMDKPNRNTANNIGTIEKGDTVKIAGSVSGKNNEDGYWEVIYKGKRAYVSGQYGKLI
ncbi:N-acetylmuramoyl-L-alanine amidase [Bacillus subtilis]|uniref:N-acetylmuramoyl-L-alanine amidase n=1 Tax=Bacillus subtilis TaxID=1423 RepID=UPI003CF6F0E4